MTDLLPCPFCASSDIHLIVDDRIYERVICDSCGCGSPTGNRWVVVAAWNRRTSPPPAVTDPVRQAQLCNPD